jgi:antitoxin HicB
MKRLEYAVVVKPLSLADGGGYVALVPDLPGCMSDGETPAEALNNVEDAILVWIEAAGEMGRSIPRPAKELALAV